MEPGLARIPPLLDNGMPAQPFGIKPPPPHQLFIFEVRGFMHVDYTVNGAIQLGNHSTITTTTASYTYQPPQQHHSATTLQEQAHSCLPNQPKYVGWSQTLCFPDQLS